jgi:hypothetical protein
MAAKKTRKPPRARKKSPPKRATAKSASRPSRPAAKAATGDSHGFASRQIDGRIKELGDWRGQTLQRLRKIILRADPEIVEEWKWDVPVWSRNGIICTGETYKNIVKLTFARGAALEDPAGLFTSSLEGKVRRAVDIHENQEIDRSALTDLVRGASALNLMGKGPAAPPPLLPGGNPQIAKADGDTPVQTYIAAMPGWKRDVGRRLDALIMRTVPEVRKAVKWNTPFYGIEGQGWFLGFHVFTNYVKVTFFRGTALRPVPPGGTGKDARWIDIHENDFDEPKLTSWVKQAAAIPGWGKN